jgi:predicted GIY-YIG superfamily endonuclease
MLSPSKVNSINKKITKAKNATKKLIQEYKSLNELRKFHKLFIRHQRKKNKNKVVKASIKKGNNDYIKYKRTSKNIEEWNRLLKSNKNMSENDDKSEDRAIMNEIIETMDNATLDDNEDSMEIENNDANTESENEDDRLETENNDISSENTNLRELEIEENMESDNEGITSEEIVTIQCENCKRKQSHNLIEMYGHNSPYFIEFSMIESIQIRNRSFKHNDVVMNESNHSLTLCHQCGLYLTLESKYQDEQYCWPSFILSLLENKSIHRIYKKWIWRFIPSNWRYWWISHVKDQFGNVFTDVTIDDPPPIFDDITMNIKKWNAKINTGDLPNLAQGCNELLLPTIMCPWGESVFIHKTGSIPIDVLFQRYLQRCEIKLIDSSNLRKVIWTRDDYVRDEGDDDIWLLNPKWKIRPSIAFLNNTPRILTCEDHNGGSVDIMIHTCRWKHHLPCEQSDQIAQIVVQSRTVKRAKASAYSSEWQMFEQRGCFGGLDTCNHVEFGRFDRPSYLRHEIENRAILNRHDVNTHLDSLTKHQIISTPMVENMRASAYDSATNTQFQKYYKGGTYVPLDVALLLQCESTDRVIKINIGGNTFVTINRYWPMTIYPCQKLTNYGAQVTIVPSFRARNTNTKNLWLISTVITQVEEVWQSFIKATRSASDWQGWLLTYLSKHCFHSKVRQSRKDPFKLNQIRTIDKLFNKLPINANFTELMNDINNNLECMNVNDFEQDYIESIFQNISNEKDVVVMKSDGELYSEYPNALTYLNKIKGINSEFELRCKIIVSNIGNSDSWNGCIYSRHGGAFKKYWYQSRSSKCPIKKNPNDTLKIGHEYIFIYVKVKESNIESMKNKYLKLLGGQTHVQCHLHNRPLITSYKKENKCSCGRKSSFCCSELDCNLNLCRKCYLSFDSNVTSFIDDNELVIDNDSDSSRSKSDDENVQNETQEFTSETLNNYVTMGEENEYLVDDTILMNANNEDDLEQEMIIPTDFIATDFIPTTNAGEIALKVEEKVKYGFKFSGCNILNNVGSLLTRSNYDIQRNRYVNHNIQKLCSTTNCESIPLLYPEGMLFPSIHWKSAHDNCSIIGAIPSSLLNANARKDGFAPIQQHLRTRLTCPSSTTSTDPRYITHCYDVMANMAASQQDTRLVINRGLTVGKDKYGSLGVRGSNDSSLLGSVDSKQMVKNLCSSQKKVQWTHFLTFTSNHKMHFGIKTIREWLDYKGWQHTFPGYHNLNNNDQSEIDNAVNQASAGLILRVWEETSKLFLDFIKNSKNSPYKKVNATFSRREYQSYSGNVAHSHIILAVDYKSLTEEESEFVNNLANGSVFDVVKSENIHEYVEKHLIPSKDSVHDLIDNGVAFLTHKCNDRCLVKNGDGTLRCRMPKYIHLTPDNTKQHFIDLPCHISDECWERLHKIGLANEMYDVDGNKNEFKSTLGYFHPKRWIPAVVPGEAPISPYESETFCICQSMQNIQRLDQAGGCCKYTCKYLAKIDKQNYISISVNKSDKNRLESNSTYLHNTKITSSDKQQQKEKVEDRDSKHPQGRCVSLTEMMHVMLRYPEVYTDLVFISVSSLPLELRCFKKITTDSEIEDGVYTNSVSQHIRSNKPNFPIWRKHTMTEQILMDDLKQSGMGYDKITQFSLRPRELKPIIDMVEHYYRWFFVDMKNKISSNEMNDLLTDNLTETHWIDGLQRKVKIRRSAIPELLEWCSYLETEEANVEVAGKESMIEVMKQIEYVLENDDEDILDDDGISFLSHVKENMIYDDEKEHLPVVVFSYVLPSNGIQFLNHILLSMGRFSTEIDLMTHSSIKECFCHAKLIGNSDEIEDLRQYSNDLLVKYIKDQIRYFPNGMRAIDSFIITAGIAFDNAIIDNGISMTDMPPFQYSILAQSMEEEFIKQRKDIIGKVVDVLYLEFQGLTVDIPSKEDLKNTSIDTQVDWDPLLHFHKSPDQNIQSYEEQRMAIQLCKNAIDSFSDIHTQTTMTKSIVVRGHPGAGKTFCMYYMMIYALSKGLMILPTAKMSHRALQLGGINWDKFLCLRASSGNVNPHRKAELAISRIQKDRRKEDLILSLHIIFADELGQISAEEIALYDIILRNIRGSTTFMGGILVIGTLDHMQIQPINGRPFLTANAVIPCFKMIALSHSVRVSGSEYLELQSLVRKDYIHFETDPSLIQHFREICSKIFTYVDDWNDERIKTNTFRVFSKRFPAKEALEIFQQRLIQKHQNSPHNLRIRKSEDVQKSRWAHDWRSASTETSQLLDKKCREPQILIFEIGLVYSCTFNDRIKSNTQKAILFDLPDQDVLDRFGAIKVLLAPPGCKEVLFHPDKTKADYIQRGYKEVSIEATPHKIYNFQHNLQANRKQYGLQNFTSGTIHSIMGDTLPSLATSFSNRDKKFGIWDKGQVVVILSRTPKPEDTIFVGDKQDTLDALESILKSRTQWTDHMENILRVVTINSIGNGDNLELSRGTMAHTAFPFQLNQVLLPTDTSGYIYMLISLRSSDFFYIGKTKDLHQRMRSHQSGFGSNSTQPEHLRPFAYFAYICGFDGNDKLMFYLERKWKENVSELRNNGIHDPRIWATQGGNGILNLDLSNFGIMDNRSELRLILLFK